MTTSVPPVKQALDARSPRPRNGESGAPEQAFDAALAAQWVLNAQALQAAPAGSTRPNGGLRNTASSTHARSSSAVTSDERGEQEGRGVSNNDPASSIRSRSLGAQGLTELSSKELAGQLPSRKEALRTSESEAAESVVAPRSGRATPAERNLSPRTSSTESPHTPSPSRAPTSPSGAQASAAQSRVEANSQGAPARSERSSHQAAGSPISSTPGTRAAVAAAASRAVQQDRAPSAVSATPPTRVASVADPLARARSNAPGLKPTATNPPAPRGVLEPEHPIAAQALRGLAAALRQGNGSVSLHLAPENLGRLRLSIAVKPSEVVARVEATSEQAAKALRENSAQLREALEAQGFAISRIEVDHVSSALLQLRERATMDQHTAPQQWGSDARSGHNGHASTHGDSKRESSLASSPGTPLAVEPRIEQVFVTADGVNTIA